MGVQETDKKCSGGKECVHRNQCPAWSIKREQLDSYTKGTQLYRDIFAELQMDVCNRNEKHVCCSLLPPINKCGRPQQMTAKSRSGRIVGGDDTSIGDFPFLALLGTDDQVICANNSTRFCWFCGGTLINDRYVLTAAHCVADVNKVRLGEHKVTRIPGKDCLRGGITCLPEVQDFDISQKDIIRHPDYNRSRDQVFNDIALIRLPRPATFNNGVQPACLPTPSELASEMLNVANLDEGLTGTHPVVVGWGHTNPFQNDQEDYFNVGVPKAIQQVLAVPVLSSSDCGESFITPEKSQICAGGDRGKDSCKVSVTY